MKLCKKRDPDLWDIIIHINGADTNESNWETSQVENYEGLPDCLAGKILIDFKAPFQHQIIALNMENLPNQNIRQLHLHEWYNVGKYNQI
jgi:hypothetical protein